MLQYLLVLCVVSTLVYANNLKEEDYGKTWMYFPDGSGDLQVAYLLEPPSDICWFASKEECYRKEVAKSQFELYTRQQPQTPTKIQLHKANKDDFEKFENRYRKDADTKIVIHGWQSDTSSDSVKKIKDAYLKDFDVNVIAVNWKDIASNYAYLMPAKRTKDVGKYVSELIIYLHETLGTDLKKIHIIGHSLGAQTAGYAGQLVKVGRITGLDPASPGFKDASPSDRLDETDADFVDVIHTCGRSLGIAKPIGHVDFYPNGLDDQPGCNAEKRVFGGPLGIFGVQACSHARAHIYFAESITSPTGFYGQKCDSYESVSNGSCSGRRVLMGDKTPVTAAGNYYLSTSPNAPFALGNN